MTGPRGPHPDAARSRLRGAVTKIDREIDRLPGQLAADDKKVPNPLREAWGELVELLALGPEPEVRECPSCHHIGMRAATVCGYCWTHLEPLG